MDLNTFAVPPDEARRAFLLYKAAAAETGSSEDAMIMRGYREIAAGRRVISLRDTMRAGGLNAEGYPNLAISRADRQRVSVDMGGQYQDYACKFYDRPPRGPSIVAGTRTVIPKGALPEWRPTDPMSHRPDKRTIVPIIPPQFRPKFQLKGYHILFEVESWELIAPVDPALLKHLGGDLYAVLAVWDLTELERSVLAITRGQPA